MTTNTATATAFWFATWEAPSLEVFLQTCADLGIATEDLEPEEGGGWGMLAFPPELEAKIRLDDDYGLKHGDVTIFVEQP